MADKRSRRSGRSRRPGRPQVPPPAMRRRVGAPFEGFDVLEEAAGHPAAPVLWQALRDVVLWGETPPEERAGLFAPGAAARRRDALQEHDPGPELAGPLAVLSRLLAEPGSTPAKQVAKACREVSRWAEESGLPRTALEYAYGGAAVLPEDADLAYRVGLLSRRHADYARAESWFRRAIGLARRQRKAQPFALAFVGLGNLYIQRGDYATARRMLDRARRTARRHGLQEVKPMVLHDLFLVSHETKQPVLAEKYAQQAYRAYGPNHPRQVVLAHDVAGFWLTQGQFRRALGVLEAILQVVTQARERLCVLGNIAYAAGGLRDRNVFLDAWIEGWAIIDHEPNAPKVASAALDLAHGAAMLHDWERAELAATFALASAVRRKEEKKKVEAERLMEQIRVGQGVELTLPDATDRGLNETSDAFASRLIQSLQAAAADPESRPRPEF